MISNHEIKQIVNPAAPEPEADKINNIILEVINDLLPELSMESDIIYPIAAAQNLQDEPVIKYELEDLLECDSSEYLLNMDGLYYLLEPFNNEIFNTFIDISDLAFYPDDFLNLDYNAYDREAIMEYLYDIDISEDMEFLSFLQTIEYLGEYLPYICGGGSYPRFTHEFKQGVIDITPELLELLKIASDEKQHQFIESTFSKIEELSLQDITTYLEELLQIKTGEAAAHAGHYNYKVLQIYQYQTY